MLLPQTTEYALRAVLRIGQRHPEPVPVNELAVAVNAPRNYLSKTLAQLARAGVLTSSRGPRGGFRLTDEPDTITLSRVIRVFGPEAPRRCLLGHGPCGKNPDCAVHGRWLPVVQQLDSFLQSTTIADLLTDQNGVRESQDVLTRPSLRPLSLASR